MVSMGTEIQTQWTKFKEEEKCERSSDLGQYSRSYF